MIAEIVCVGTELLLGDIVNTNAQFLAQELAHLGIEVHYQTVVGDNPQRIKNALDIAFSRADTIITTGGLGPTKDDLTKEVVSGYFHKELILDEPALEMMKKRLQQRLGSCVISESNRKQAFLPEGSLILYNHHGTAPGCIVEEQGKTVIILPGPPKEMRPMFEQCIDLYLKHRTDKTFVSVTIRLNGIGESAAADKVTHLLDGSNPTVAPYAKEDGVTFRITASAPTRDEAIELINPVVEEMKELLTGLIVEISEPK